MEELVAFLNKLPNGDVPEPYNELERLLRMNLNGTDLNLWLEADDLRGIQNVKCESLILTFDLEQHSGPGITGGPVVRSWKLDMRPDRHTASIVGVRQV